MSDRPRLTNLDGTPVPDNQNSLTAGPRGPILMQDFHLLEKMAQFNRERIPERVVHAKGSGAFGTFTVTNDITKYCKAKLFESVGKRTPLFARFSTVGGEKGSADAARDPRGFAVKFYTEEGNWDLVGNNTPIFFVRDPMKFGDFIHTQKRCPASGLKDPTMQWDFWSLYPEALHQVTILFSDRGTPRSYRHMNGYGSHTFSFINANDERFWVKFHFKTEQGIANFTAEEAEEACGSNPDNARQDLREAIDRGDFPKWRLVVQVMPEEEAERTPYNPFDLTKVWPHGDYPPIEVGVMELDRNPANFFAEVEQSAFNVSAVVPGIGFSPDKMLQARVMSYADAHRYRLGAQYQFFPVNRPRCPVHTYHQRDGVAAALRPDNNNGGLPNYEPNSFDGPVEGPEFREPPLRIDGDADRYDSHRGHDDYSQVGNLFRVLKPDERERLIGNIVADLGTVSKEIQMRQLPHFFRAHPEYGEGVARGLGIDPAEVPGIDREMADAR